MKGLTVASGYSSAAYANSLSEFGEPVALPRSGGFLLKRSIPHALAKDAMACYPLLCCHDWRVLSEDLREIPDAVSVVAVIDPFAEVHVSELQTAFPDVTREFKPHYVVDLREPQTSTSHRRKVRLALNAVEVVRADSPEIYLDDWCRLYAYLCTRHSIKGMRRFSRASFEQQLAVNGCLLFVAMMSDQPAAACIWYVMGDVAYYHLGASDERGYEVSAPYALFFEAFRYLATEGVRWACLGSTAGLAAGADGLDQFKRGWATGTRMTYLCGRIQDREAYDELCRGRLVNQQRTTYFPAYREGETL